MALNFPGDLELIKDGIQLSLIGLIAVLYKYPQNTQGLQYLAKASRLGIDVGGATYAVLIATAGQHMENKKLPGVILLTRESGFYVPLTVKDFSSVLTNGDAAALFNQLDAIQAEIKPTYGMQNVQVH